VRRRPEGPSPLRLPILAAAWVVAIVAAGCTTLGPDYQRPEVKLAETWRVAPGDAADLANTEWWRAFGDPQLDAHIETALAANQDLQIATLNVQQFEARLQISEAASYPVLGYTASGQRERRSEERPNGLRPGSSASLSNFEVAGNATWELDLWGRVKRANEAARAELLGTQEMRRGVMLSVVAGVAESYLKLVEADERLALAEQTVANRREALRLQQFKFEGGEATRMAVLQAQGRLDEELARIPSIQQDVATLENALSALLGRGPARIERRRIDGLKLDLPRLPSGVPADVLTRRPDVLQAEQDLVAANSRIGVAKAAYFPRISLNAILGVAADDLKWLTAETARTGNFGGGIAGTLFDGGRIAAGIREAEIVQREMALKWQRTVTQALVEVEAALVARDKAGEVEAARGRRVATQEQVVDLVRRRQEGGQSTRFDVLDNELTLINLQRERLTSRGDTLRSLVAVYKAMGGGWMMEYDRRQAATNAAAAPETQR
jgi:outer membrane protein, multidrug efflux system